MTGNSLDAVDVVLSAFEGKSIRDLCSHTLKYPSQLRDSLLELREIIRRHNSNMNEVATEPAFVPAVDNYTRLVAEAVNQLVAKSGLAVGEIAAIGFHGQTCDHFPPSVAKGQAAYTLQVGNPRLLADLTGLPVIYDFRSDDIMNGGEGAPLAPLHNMHIAETLAEKGIASAAFCNGGNTGNIAVISMGKDGEMPLVAGWDIGPFNHFADKLMREKKGLPCDENGQYGSAGTVNENLLRQLFASAAVNQAGENFYLQQPPKSSDPRWYKLIYDDSLPFADNLRTVEYLSAYSYVYNLKYLPQNFLMPGLFLLFGGGWKNPLVKADFNALLQGKGMVLPEHQDVFAGIYNRLPKNITVDWSDAYGFSGEYMEARIFADMAYCKIVGQPFSLPSTTNCKKPTVGGVYVLPAAPKNDLLMRLLRQYGNPALPESNVQLWNRAAKGWQG